ncbi:Uncharacterised protein [Yersinia thracica]|uniref:Uncharacterized protein n=1 Tax=Yersinia thracica TaxID=2890319 RepID=A0A0T9R2C2_9GAMM|nr:Uncharacterised protein [Yersinia thracica]
MVAFLLIKQTMTKLIFELLTGVLEILCHSAKVFKKRNDI